MKLLLPDHDYVCKDDSGEVKDRILYIYRPGALKDIMYELSYEIFGQNECYYCHRKLRPDMLHQGNDKYFSKVTLDHLIPQNFGGPTITNNLRPCCSDCNSSKSNMFPDEFEVYRKLHAKQDKQSKDEESRFRAQIELTQERRRKGEIPSIPEEWRTSEQIHSIYVNFWISHPLGAGYSEQEKFYKKYGRLQDDIIITANRFVVDGFNTLLFAKNAGIELLHIIDLENAIYVFPR